MKNIDFLKIWGKFRIEKAFFFNQRKYFGSRFRGEIILSIPSCREVSFVIFYIGDMTYLSANYDIWRLETERSKLDMSIIFETIFWRILEWKRTSGHTCITHPYKYKSINTYFIYRYIYIFSTSNINNTFKTFDFFVFWPYIPLRINKQVSTPTHIIIYIFQNLIITTHSNLPTSPHQTHPQYPSPSSPQNLNFWFYHTFFEYTNFPDTDIFGFVIVRFSILRY